MKKLNTIILIFAGDDMYSVVCCTIEFDISSKPNDSEAFYFTPENYPIKADGRWMYRMLCRQRLIK